MQKNVVRRLRVYSTTKRVWAACAGRRTGDHMATVHLALTAGLQQLRSALVGGDVLHITMALGQLVSARPARFGWYGLGSHLPL